MTRLFHLISAFFLALAGYCQWMLWRNAQSLGRLIYTIYRGEKHPHLDGMSEDRRDALIKNETSLQQCFGVLRTIFLCISGMMCLLALLTRKKQQAV